jgi:hypothetical protein
MNYTYVYEDLRGMWGVDDLIISDNLIDTLSNMPAAEMEFAKRLTVDITTLTGDDLTNARLAILYLTAANLVPSVRVNILRIETDNKTTAQRFKDALNFDENFFRRKADKLIDELETAGATTHPDVLEFVRPTVNVVTGKVYDS